MKLVQPPLGLAPPFVGFMARFLLGLPASGRTLSGPGVAVRIWDFPTIRVPYFGVLNIRILLFRVRKKGPLFSETPI